MADNTLLEIHEHDTLLEVHTGGRDALLLWGQRLSAPAAVVGHVPSYAGADTIAWTDPAVLLAGTFVSTAGDTMTGDLNMAGDVVPTTHNARSLGTSANRWAAIWTALATLGGTTFEGHALPNVDNGLNLGAAGTRWANVYATSLTGTLATAAQPNVTSLGTLTSLTVAGAHKLAAGQRLYLDGGGNTYLVESAGDRVDLVTGGVNRLRIDDSGVSIVDSHLLITSNRDVRPTADHPTALEFTNAAGTIKLLALDTAAAALVMGDTVTLRWSDVALARGAANRLDLASGDSFNLVAGSYKIGASDVLTRSGGIVQTGSVDNSETLKVRGAAVIVNTAGFDRVEFAAAGDFLLGTTVAPTAGGGKVMVFGDNGGDPTMGANVAGIYARDVAGTVEMFVVDEADVATQISPHDADGYWFLNHRVPARYDGWMRVHVERWMERVTDTLNDLCDEMGLTGLERERYFERIAA